MCLHCLPTSSSRVSLISVTQDAMDDLIAGKAVIVKATGYAWIDAKGPDFLSAVLSSNPSQERLKSKTEHA